MQSFKKYGLKTILCVVSHIQEDDEENLVVYYTMIIIRRMVNN